MELEDTIEVNERVRYDISQQRSGEVRAPTVDKNPLLDKSGILCAALLEF